MKKFISLLIITIFAGLVFWSCGSDDSSTEPGNKAPTCTITLPVNNAIFTIGTAINVALTATDEDGSVVEVKLYLNNSIVDTLEQSPFAYTFETSDLLPGNYVIKAVAKDNEGSETASQVTIVLKTTYEITLTTPNGGETLPMGTSQIINWTSNLPENVKIELYKSGVLAYEIISSTENDGQYSWAIPTSLSLASDYKIKITGTTSTYITDQSNSNFSVAAASSSPFITITSPNGSENWLSGKTQEIKWASNFTDDIKIELYKGNSLVSTISEQVLNTGSYNWAVPTSIVNGSDYKIKVTQRLNYSIFDTSDDNVNIGSIIITFPNGGEILTPNKEYEIKWLYSISATVTLKLYINDVYYSSVVSNINSNSAQFTWKVPFITTGDIYKIAITNSTNTITYDVSNINFEVAPLITISQPNGNDIMLPNSQYPIKWSRNVEEPLKIDLLKSGIFYMSITESSSTSYLWSVPDNLTGSDYQIKISHPTNPEFFDVSDYNFSFSGMFYKKYGGIDTEGFGSAVHTNDGGYIIVGLPNLMGQDQLIYGWLK